MINIILVTLFIIFSAFFSASETAIFSLSSTRLKKMQARYPKAKKLKYLLRRPSHLLSTIVFGNMLVNIGLASLCTALFVGVFKQKGVIVAIIFSGLIILFLGEVFPKSIAIYLAEKISLISAPILDFLSKLFYPIIFSVQKLSDYISFFFIKKKNKEIPFTEEELKTALILGKKEGVISEAEEEMVSYVLKFKETSVSQIMTPRVEIQAINIQDSQEEVLRALRERRYSKFPVYKEFLDNISGVIYSKNVFLNPEENWRAFIKEILFFPESKKIDDILKIFVEKNERIAIVLDEYGGTAGLVTFEDIVEEIFGEIYDEYELPQELVEKIDSKTYRVFGKTPIKTINLELNVNLPEDEDTIAGFLLSKLEKIPHPEERFNFAGIEFIIERASRKRLLNIILKIK